MNNYFEIYFRSRIFGSNPRIVENKRDFVSLAGNSFNVAGDVAFSKYPIGFGFCFHVIHCTEIRFSNHIEKPTKNFFAYEANQTFAGCDRKKYHAVVPLLPPNDVEWCEDVQSFATGQLNFS